MIWAYRRPNIFPACIDLLAWAAGLVGGAVLSLVFSRGRIGWTLAMTILLESGDFARFPSCADYASYCRTVRSRKISNGKNKGRNNGRNGNPHLAWAFAEAAVFTQRFDPVAKAWFERKAKRRNRQVAYKALACKLSKAVWHVMNGNAYDSRRLFM